MQNIKELREKLSQNYKEMENGTRSLKLGKELANTAGKIIGSLAVELNYNNSMEYQKKIDNSNYVNSPFEDYNNRGDCVQELINNGWKFVFEKGSNIHLKRPGSTDSRTSANFSKEHNKFYVFTTSSEFKENTAYSPVAVYCKLNHNDNWSDCAKELILKGYGKKREIIGKKYASVIQRMKKEDATKDDIVIELRKIEGKPLDEIETIIDNYETNLGKKISTFWKVDINQKGEPKITISYYDFCRFINDSLIVQ